MKERALIFPETFFPECEAPLNRQSPTWLFLLSVVILFTIVHFAVDMVPGISHTQRPGEGAAYVTLSGVVEAGAVLASGPLAILAGLLLPASKWWGWPGIDLTGWWRDPCDELFSRICEAYTEHIEQRGSFPTGFVSGSPDVMNLLSSVGHIITLCAQFLRDCPNHGRKGTIQFIQQTATGYQQQYWNF